MVRFSKKLEYSLISLRHIANSPAELTTARDISSKYNIPHDLCAKILQTLKKEGILESIQGINGGYKLTRSLRKISLSELFNIVDGSTAIVECVQSDESGCIISDNCTIKDPINKMQIEFENMLKIKMVSDFI